MDQLRQSLAIGAEVSIVANGTLIAVSHDIFAVISAERAITKDANVALVASGLLGHWLV